MRRNPRLQVPRPIDTPAVINSRCSIKVGIRSPPALIDTLRQSITISCTGRSIVNHLCDGCIRARGVDFAGYVRVAGSSAVMVLHKPWVTDTVVGCWNSNTATGFLDDCCEDEAVVDSGPGGDCFDCVPDGSDLRSRVIINSPGRAGREHDCFVGVEPGRMRLGI